LIALGVDILDPIQPVAPEMASRAIKGRIRRSALFPRRDGHANGCCRFGTPEHVRAEARRYCATLGAGGGYILAPAHLFQPDVPPENILAVYQAER